MVRAIVNYPAHGRLILAIGCVLFLGAVAQAQTAVPEPRNASLRISGVVTEIRTRRQGERVLANELVVKVTVVNHGKTTILLIPDQFEVYGGVISTNDGANVGSYSNANSATVISLAELRKGFTASRPDPRKTLRLKPGESWRSDAALDLDSKRMIVDPDRTLPELRKHGRLMVTLKCRFVESLYEDRGRIHSSRAFWAQVRRRWSQFGYLWIDDLNSEPILMDMGSVTITNADAR